MKTITQHRNIDFLTTCNNIACDPGFGSIIPTVKMVIEKALNRQAPRYYVDIDLAESNLNAILSGNVSIRDDTLSQRNKMWFEILTKLRRLDGIKGNRVRRPMLAYLLKQSKASSFFITRSYAYALYFKSRKMPLSVTTHLRHNQK